MVPGLLQAIAQPVADDARAVANLVGRIAAAVLRGSPEDHLDVFANLTLAALVFKVGEPAIELLAPGIAVHRGPVGKRPNQSASDAGLQLTQG